MGIFHRRNGFYTVQTVISIALHLALHLNLPLAGNFFQFYFLKKLGKFPHQSPSLCNTYVIPMSLYEVMSSDVTKMHKHTHTHTHTLSTYVYKYTTFVFSQEQQTEVILVFEN